MANPSLYVLLPFTFFLLILHFLFSQASKNPDLEPLLAFKACTDKANKLTTWNSTSHVPGQASRASTTESHDSISKTSISRAHSSRSPLWLSSKFSASSKTVSQVPFLTSPTSRLLSSSSSLTTTSLASSRCQCRLFSDCTVLIYRTIIFPARFQYRSTVAVGIFGLWDLMIDEFFGLFFLWVFWVFWVY